MTIFQFLKEVGCLPPCHIPTFDIAGQNLTEEPTGGANVSEQDEDLSIVFLSPFPSRLQALLARLIFQFMVKKQFFYSRIVKEEFLIYDLESLAGVLGGILGMLLGTSVLALYHICQSGMRKRF